MPGASEAEKWIIRIAGAVLTIVGLYMADTMRDMNMSITAAMVDVAKIRQELADTKPADVLAAVNELARKSLTPAEVERIVRKAAPWVEDKRTWMEWRARIEERMRDLEKR